MTTDELLEELSKVMQIELRYGLYFGNERWVAMGCFENKDRHWSGKTPKEALQRLWEEVKK